MKKCCIMDGAVVISCHICGKGGFIDYYTSGVYSAIILARERRLFLSTRLVQLLPEMKFILIGFLFMVYFHSTVAPRKWSSSSDPSPKTHGRALCHELAKLGHAVREGTQDPDCLRNVAEELLNKYKNTDMVQKICRNGFKKKTEQNRLRRIGCNFINDTFDKGWDFVEVGQTSNLNLNVVEEASQTSNLDLNVALNEDCSEFQD